MQFTTQALTFFTALLLSVSSVQAECTEVIQGAANYGGYQTCTGGLVWCGSGPSGGYSKLCCPDRSCKSIWYNPRVTSDLRCHVI